MKEQLTCFDVDEAKKATNTKQGVSNCKETYHVILVSSLLLTVLAPLIMHGQSMNGLRRSFLCRVKKMNSQKSSHNTSRSPALEVDCNNTENVIKLLQSTQECIPYQYAVLHCTGFIRYQ